MKNVGKSNFKLLTIPYFLKQVKRRGGNIFQVKKIEDGSGSSLWNWEGMGIGNRDDRVQATSIYYLIK